MLRFHPGFLITGIVLVAVVYVVTLIAFPQWTTSWVLLFVLFALVAGGVVTFLKDARQAFEDKLEPPENNSADEVPDETRADDSRKTRISWKYRDSRLLRKYFTLCAQYDTEYNRLTSDEKSIRDYLISGGLAYQGKDGHTYLTWAGTLFCCQHEHLPRNLFHVHVKLKQETGKTSLNAELHGSVLFLYYELYERLTPLFQHRMGSPDWRAKSGSERVFSEYPEVAVVEALVNFLIHRDYSLEDQGFITVYSDRVEFINPGQSDISPEILLNTPTVLRPRYARNQRLIEAMNKARLNQAEGSGILRIRNSLAENGTYLAPGKLGLEISNDPQQNRFALTIYKRSLLNTVSTPTLAPSGSAAPPARTTHFVSRGKIMDDIRAALESQTAVAVVGVAGMGGVGKTELAKFLAGELEREGKHRVIWLGVYNRPLADLQNELSRALGIAFLPNATEQSRYEMILAAFHDNPGIVFFDDVYKSAIPALKFLLPPSPPCAALITSRQRELGVGARVFELDVMTLEQSLELLREAHGLTDALAREPDATRELCRFCGYLPLALDIAASRLRKQLHFSKTPIAAFNQSLANRLKELQRGAQPSREDSITVNIALSYADLDDADRRRLRGIAVFAPSGFAPRAAATLWGEDDTDARTSIERLQDGSLVMNAETAGRFRLHDLVRDFALMNLNESGESDAANRAHAEFLIALFDEEYTNVSPESPAALELENLVLAANWAHNKHEAQLLALLATKPRNWLYVHWTEFWNEWIVWLNDALRMDGDYKPDLRANVLQAIGDIQQFRKENDAALKSYAQALALFRSVGARLGEANVLQAIGDVQQFRKDNDAALDSYAQALALFRSVGARLGEANVLQAIGDVQQFRDERDAALKSYEQALALFRSVGARLGEANVLKAIGDMQQFRKENDAALKSYEQALALFHSVGDRLGEANVLKAIGDVQQFREENETALRSYEQAMKLFRTIGDRLGEANVLQAIGNVQEFRDERDAALASYTQALELFHTVGAKLGEANVLAALGRLFARGGNLAQAEQNLTEAVTVRRAIGDLYGEGTDYGNFAIALLNVDEKSIARTYAVKAKQIFEKFGVPSLIRWADHLVAATNIGDMNTAPTHTETKTTEQNLSGIKSDLDSTLQIHPTSGNN